MKWTELLHKVEEFFFYFLGCNVRENPKNQGFHLRLNLGFTMHHFKIFFSKNRTAGVFVYKNYTNAYVFSNVFNSQIMIMMHF